MITMIIIAFRFSIISIRPTISIMGNICTARLSNIWSSIFIMGVYNVAIHTGELQAVTFKHALHSFPLEWFIGLLCAFFIASKTSKYFAFRVAKLTDRPIFIILCIQTFTVCTMVPLMSLQRVPQKHVPHADEL